MSHPQTLLAPAHSHRAPAGSEPPPGAAADWTVPQHWDELTDEDHWVWDTLFSRQKTLLHGRAVKEFEEGLDLLSLSRSGIPDFDELNEKLSARTGWIVVAVPDLIPDEVFFHHLTERRLPVGDFIRSPKQLDYLGEPDVFHDVFGHEPLLAQPAVAEFMMELGQLGLKAIESNAIDRVSRLYWYTIETGLALERGEVKIYGAGILSSFGETHYCLESARPRRLKFDLERVLRTAYRPDEYQQCYFVLDRFDDLASVIRGQDLTALFAQLDGSPDLDPASAGPDDEVRIP
jgi:phenylalanine-4-hydroxylase